MRKTSTRKVQRAGCRWQYGWFCLHCACIVLEYRRARLTFCPSCNGSEWDPDLYTIIAPTATQANKR